MNVINQCPNCEWNPDDKEHWACSCGHKWNTFITSGKCPKCKTQWADTRCPACGKSSPHSDWHMTKHQIELIENSGNQELRAKKRSLESRLIGYGIKNYQVSHLPYLDCSREKFQSPYDAGCRMMILYAIAYSADNLNERKSLIRWLKDEKIWDKVSLNEKEFLNNKEPIESLCQDLTWRIESALTLGWCLKKIRSLPKLDEDNIESEIEEFQKNVPQLGDSLMPFLTKLEFRDYGEIYEENLVNEMPTTYFRDLIFNGNEDETNIDSQVSFERHNVLNWLRQYAGIEEWDETDTST